MTNFLITGATGRLGGAAVRSLLTHVPAHDVLVLVRNSEDANRLPAEGLTARLADYSHPQNLFDAFTGIDRMLFVSSPVLDPAVRAVQHKAVIESATAAGVGHIVYTSAMGAQHDPGHTAAETALSDSGVSYTILRNSLYTDPFIAHAIDEAHTGTVRSASGNQPIVTASIADLAEGAVRSLLSPPKRSLWELRGPAWTFDELAKTLSHLMDKPIGHEQVNDAETGSFSALFPLVRHGFFSVETNDLDTLLERHPQGIESVAMEQLHMSH